MFGDVIKTTSIIVVNHGHSAPNEQTKKDVFFKISEKRGTKSRSDPFKGTHTVNTEPPVFVSSNRSTNLGGDRKQNLALQTHTSSNIYIDRYLAQSNGLYSL